MKANCQETVKPITMNRFSRCESRNTGMAKIAMRSSVHKCIVIVLGSWGRLVKSTQKCLEFTANNENSCFWNLPESCMFGIQYTLISPLLIRLIKTTYTNIQNHEAINFFIINQLIKQLQNYIRSTASATKVGVLSKFNR